MSSKNCLQTFFIILIIVIVCLLIVNQVKLYNIAHVLDIEQKQENFAENSPNTKKSRFVLYYTSWCGHSRNFIKDVWTNLLSQVKNDSDLSKKIDLISISCEENENMCNKEGITGYPSLVFYDQNNVALPFEGNRSPENIISFLKSK